MNLSQLFIRDLIRASDLSEKSKDIFLKRLAGQKLEEIGNEYGISRERVRQFEARMIRELKVPYRLGLSHKGYKVKMYEEPLGNNHFRAITIDDMDKTSIEVLELPIRIIRALARFGIVTMGEAKKRIDVLWKPRGMGPKSVKRVKEQLEKYYGTDTL